MDRLTVPGTMPTLIADLTCAANGSYTENYIRALCERAAEALQSLSQEAVRDEALEEAAKLCEADLRYFSEGFANGCRECAKAIRALKREPNAAVARCPDGLLCPRDYKRAQLTQQELNNPAPAAPDVASMVKRLLRVSRDLEMDEIVRDRVDAAALLAKLGQGWVPESQGFFAIGHTEEQGYPLSEQVVWLYRFDGGVNGVWDADPQGAMPFIHKRDADGVMTIPGIACYRPFVQWITHAARSLR